MAYSYIINAMPDTHVDRRNFLRGASALTALSYSSVLGANEKLHLGIIGAGDRGTHDMGNFQKDPNVEFIAVCDIWGDHVAHALQTAKGAKSYADHRKVLDMKDVDAVLIATPDHWHVPITIDALNAGKDVYVEKPLTLMPDEGASGEGRASEQSDLPSGNAATLRLALFAGQG